MKRLTAWVSLALALWACGGGDDDDGAGSCAPGTESVCACPDGSMSVQPCTVEGTFAPCACGGPAAQGGSVSGPGEVPASGGAGNGGGTVDPSDPFDAARQACVDKINMLRATLDLPPFERWVDGEACADEESRLDTESGVAHGSFGMCDENAQNSCTRVRSLDITRCLDNMFAEGPPPVMPCRDQCFQDHGHFMNITSTRYTRVACGFYDIPGSDRFWALQNFQ